MRQFNTPPEWPDPPTPDWRPPRRWQPPKSWPKAPDRWVFWVDEYGRGVRGPIGRYGGPRRITTAIMVVVPTALMALVLLNPFSSDSDSTAPLLGPTAPVTQAPIERSAKPARAERPPTATTTYRSCAQVRAAGKAPLHRGDPGYSRALDPDGDGVACPPVARGNS
ncbi:excalibur calcium-binding domain-containing protein [Kribbella sp. NBC_00662]|uniref:excalibur calcium-binding domain-containing protein n=1 Tax=Kribbella sp. NBC_00662 TaxID=2975969 RepID=UPI00324E6EFB